MINIFSLPEDNLASVRRAAMTTSIILGIVCFYNLKIDVRALGFITGSTTEIDPTLSLTLILGYMIVRLVKLAEWALPLAHRDLALNDPQTQKLLESLEKCHDAQSDRQQWIDALEALNLDEFDQFSKKAARVTSYVQRMVAEINVPPDWNFTNEPHFKNTAVMLQDAHKKHMPIVDILNDIVSKSSTQEYWNDLKDIREFSSHILSVFRITVMERTKNTHPYDVACNAIFELDEDYQVAMSKKKADVWLYGYFIPLVFLQCSYVVGNGSSCFKLP